MTTSAGLDLIETEQGFTLQIDNADGSQSSALITPEQLLTLAQSAPLLRDRALAKLRPAGSEAMPIFSTPVAFVELNHDAMQENILLKMIVATGDWQSFSLPAHVAVGLWKRLPDWIAKLATNPGARQ